MTPYTENAKELIDHLIKLGKSEAEGIGQKREAAFTHLKTTYDNGDLSFKDLNAIYEIIEENCLGKLGYVASSDGHALDYLFSPQAQETKIKKALTFNKHVPKYVWQFADEKAYPISSTGKAFLELLQNYAIDTIEKIDAPLKQFHLLNDIYTAPPQHKLAYGKSAGFAKHNLKKGSTGPKNKLCPRFKAYVDDQFSGALSQKMKAIDDELIRYFEALKKEKSEEYPNEHLPEKPEDFQAKFHAIFYRYQAASPFRDLQQYWYAPQEIKNLINHFLGNNWDVASFLIAKKIDFFCRLFQANIVLLPETCKKMMGNARCQTFYLTELDMTLIAQLLTQVTWDQKWQPFLCPDKKTREHTIIKDNFLFFFQWKLYRLAEQDVLRNHEGLNQKSRLETVLGLYHNKLIKAHDPAPLDTFPDCAAKEAAPKQSLFKKADDYQPYSHVDTFQLDEQALPPWQAILRYGEILSILVRTDLDMVEKERKIHDLVQYGLKDPKLLIHHLLQFVQAIFEVDEKGLKVPKLGDGNLFSILFLAQNAKSSNAFTPFFHEFKSMLTACFIEKIKILPFLDKLNFITSILKDQQDPYYFFYAYYGKSMNHVEKKNFIMTAALDEIIILLMAELQDEILGQIHHKDDSMEMQPLSSIQSFKTLYGQLVDGSLAETDKAHLRTNFVAFNQFFFGTFHVQMSPHLEQQRSALKQAYVQLLVDGLETYCNVENKRLAKKIQRYQTSLGIEGLWDPSLCVSKTLQKALDQKEKEVNMIATAPGHASKWLIEMLTCYGKDHTKADRPTLRANAEQLLKRFCDRDDITYIHLGEVYAGLLEIVLSGETYDHPTKQSLDYLFAPKNLAKYTWIGHDQFNISSTGKVLLESLQLAAVESLRRLPFSAQMDPLYDILHAYDKSSQSSENTFLFSFAKKRVASANKMAKSHLHVSYLRPCQAFADFLKTYTDKLPLANDAVSTYFYGLLADNAANDPPQKPANFRDQLSLILSMTTEKKHKAIPCEMLIATNKTIFSFLRSSIQKATDDTLHLALDIIYSIFQDKLYHLPNAHRQVIADARCAATLLSQLDVVLLTQLMSPEFHHNHHYSSTVEFFNLDPKPSVDQNIKDAFQFMQAKLLAAMQLPNTEENSTQKAFIKAIFALFKTSGSVKVFSADLPTCKAKQKMNSNKYFPLAQFLTDEDYTWDQERHTWIEKTNESRIRNQLMRSDLSRESKESILKDWIHQYKNELYLLRSIFEHINTQPQYTKILAPKPTTLSNKFEHQHKFQDTPLSSFGYDLMLHMQQAAIHLLDEMSAPERWFAVGHYLNRKDFPLILCDPSQHAKLPSKSFIRVLADCDNEVTNAIKGVLQNAPFNALDAPHQPASPFISLYQQAIERKLDKKGFDDFFSYIRCIIEISTLTGPGYCNHSIGYLKKQNLLDFQKTLESDFMAIMTDYLNLPCATEAELISHLNNCDSLFLQISDLHSKSLLNVFNDRKKQSKIVLQSDVIAIKNLAGLSRSSAIDLQNAMQQIADRITLNFSSISDPTVLEQHVKRLNEIFFTIQKLFSKKNIEAVPGFTEIMKRTLRDFLGLSINIQPILTRVVLESHHQDGGETEKYFLIQDEKVIVKVADDGTIETISTPEVTRALEKYLQEFPQRKASQAALEDALSRYLAEATPFYKTYPKLMKRIDFGMNNKPPMVFFDTAAKMEKQNFLCNSPY